MLGPWARARDCYPLVTADLSTESFPFGTTREIEIDPRECA
jgi:hypothetical protein